MITLIAPFNRNLILPVVDVVFSNVKTSFKE